MSVFLIAQVDVLNEELYGRYQEAAPPLQRWGGEVLAYDPAPKAVEGSIARARMAIVRFPSHEQFRSWYESPEYQAARQHRIGGGAEADLILIEGLPAAT